MIIRIMGTSGSGKTTLVARLMREARRVRPWYDPTVRKLPLGHVLNFGNDSLPELNGTFLVGYYHDGVGGCDNLPGAMRDRGRFFEELLPRWQNERRHVLYEGVVFGDEVTRTVALARTHLSVVVYLTTSLDVCLLSIAGRRAAQGKSPAFNEKQTADRHRQLQNVAQRLRSSGVQVEKLDRQGAYDFIKRELSK